MMKEKCETLLEALREELYAIEAEHPPGLKKMVMGLAAVRKALATLREWVVTDGFASMEEEVSFFKFWKPSFYSWQIYYVELGAIEDCLPANDAELRRVYLKEQLTFIERFLPPAGFSLPVL